MSLWSYVSELSVTLKSQIWVKICFQLYYFIIGLIRENSQSGLVMSQDLTMAKYRTSKNCFKNH